MRSPEATGFEVQKAGGLPTFICEVARAIKRSGKTTSQAIAIAVSRMKVWAVTGEPDTKAKAAKALAEWEKLRAKSKAKTAKKIATSHGSEDEEYVFLAKLDVPEFSIESVRMAWEKKNREDRQAAREARRAQDQDPYDGSPESDYRYVREMWSTFMILQGEDSGGLYYKVPYSVTSKGAVTFGKEQKVVVDYKPIKDSSQSTEETSEVAMSALDLDAWADLTSVALTPSERIALAMEKPYGDVKYADPGYRDSRKRYPLDSEAHCRAAWSYINMPKNQKGYTAAQLASIKAKIKSALKKYGAEIAASAPVSAVESLISLVKAK